MECEASKKARELKVSTSVQKRHWVLTTSEVRLELPELSLLGLWEMDLEEPRAALKEVTRPAAILRGSWSPASKAHVLTDEGRHVGFRESKLGFQVGARSNKSQGHQQW